MSKITHTIMRSLLEKRGCDIYKDFNFPKLLYIEQDDSTMSSVNVEYYWHYLSYFFWDLLEIKHKEIFDILFNPKDYAFLKAYADCYRISYSGKEIKPSPNELLKWIRDRRYLEHGIKLSKPIK